MVAAALVCLLVAAVYPSAGAALRSSAAVPLLRPRLRLLGVLGGTSPLPETMVAAPVTDDFEDADAEGQDGVAARRGGRRCYGTEWRRLPCREGVPPSPRSWRSCGGLRRRNVQLEDDGAEAQEGFFVISLVSWVFL